MSLADAVKEGQLQGLTELRDILAAEIDDCDSDRDLAALALRLTDVLERIEAMPQSREVSAADEIAQRRAQRRSV